MGESNLDRSTSEQNQEPWLAELLAPEKSLDSDTAWGELFDAAEQQSTSPFPIVGIAVPQGAEGACSELLHSLPADTGMAYVFVQPASDGAEPLARVLSPETPLPITEVTQATRPEPGHVYVLSAGTARMNDGEIIVHDPPTSGIATAIDAFLTSLASAKGNHAIGVVLGGARNDGGPLGLRAVKDHGGITILESTGATQYESRPLGSELEHVDRFLPVAQIAVELVQVDRHFRQPGFHPWDATWNDAEAQLAYLDILGLLKGVSGLNFQVYIPSVVRRRISRRMLLNRISSLGEYATLLKSNPTELFALHEEILIRPTRFFRDPQVFWALRDSLLPQLLANRSPDQPLRIWVPRCGTGEEAYSIAICVSELLTGTELDGGVQIFGTDASHQSIHRARTGIFPESLAQEISAELLKDFFVKVAGGYQIARHVRDLCVFARHDLFHDPPFPRMDLVSCRDLLNTFEIEAKQQVLAALHYALLPDGMLVLGSSDTSSATPGLFQLIDPKNRVYTRLSDEHSHVKLSIPTRMPPMDVDLRPSKSVSGAWPNMELRRAVDRLTLARYAPPSLVVDERLRIVYSRGDVTPFLETPEGSVSMPAARLLRGDLAPVVSQALQQSVAQHLPVRTGSVSVQVGDHQREIAIEVSPIRVFTRGKRYFLVTFSPLHELSAPSVREEISGGPGDDLLERLRQDLASTTRYLHMLLEERDLRKRELALSNQEIQSAIKATNYANQETANLKDELRNAEHALATVEDLRQRNAELTQTANDLSDLFHSLAVPVLHLDGELQIRQISAAAQRLLHLSAADIGQPFADVLRDRLDSRCMTLFQRVLETLTPGEMEVLDGDGRFHLLRASLYRTADHRIAGVVAVLTDLERFRTRERELQSSRDFALAQIESLPMALAVVDPGLRLQVVNDAFRNLAGIGGEDISGRSFTDLALARWGLEEPLRTHLDNLRNSKDAGGRFIFEHTTPGESSRVLDIRGCGLKYGEENSLLVTIQDITAHKDVERFLALEGERLAEEVTATTRELSRTQEELRALAANLLQSQEEERRRVARELHDDISQKLAVLEMDAQQAEPQIAADPGRARQEIERLRTAIGGLSEEVRRISHALHPSVIEDLGIRSALRSLVEDFREREDMIVTFRSHEVPDGIPLEIATALYRITQEALRNIAKHAGRSHVKVLLEGEATRIRLQVIDSGKGFDTQARRLGLGLVSIGERARIMGGKFTIESKLGEGTRVTVEVPLP